MFTPAEQIDLALGGLAPDPKSMRAAAIEARKGRGRPRGARNKRTEELRAYLLSRYRHPLETLAAIQSQDPDILAAELGCSELEATGLIIKAAAELGPFVASRLPVEVLMQGQGHMTFVMGAGFQLAGAPGTAPIGDTIDAANWLRIAVPEVAEKLGISDAGDEVSE